MGSVGTIEKMYQQYKDVAEFRMIYIREAHAADSNWPVGYAKQKGINLAKTFDQRCATASMLIKEKDFTVPTFIDGMDNKANEAYSAHPDRVFLIRTDGRLAVAAARGPFGFKPGLTATTSWLKEFKASGKEPALPADLLKAAREKESQKTPSKE